MGKLLHRIVSVDLDGKLVEVIQERIIEVNGLAVGKNTFRFINWEGRQQVVSRGLPGMGGYHLPPGVCPCGNHLDDDEDEICIACQQEESHKRLWGSGLPN